MQYRNTYKESSAFVNTANATETLQGGHNGRDGISNHQPPDCLLNRVFKAQIKENIKAPRPGLCEGNSLVIGEFLAQMASNAENVSIWWRYH